MTRGVGRGWAVAVALTAGLLWWSGAAGARQAVWSHLVEEAEGQVLADRLEVVFVDERVIDEADRFRPHPFDPDLAVRALNRQGREGYRAFAAATRPNDDGLIRLRVHVRRD